MERDSDVLQETPDLDFDDNAMDEQEMPDIHFTNHIEMETPDIDFSENVDSLNKSHESHFAVDESEIDDMDEPDQYVEDEDNNNDNDADDDDDGDADSIPKENSESGKPSIFPLVCISFCLISIRLICLLLFFSSVIAQN